MNILAVQKSKKLPLSAGNKARNLQRLMEIGMFVPRTYILTWETYRRFLDNDIGLEEELRREITRIVDPNRLYAVRSSANIEDSLERSFAGQFNSVLNVQGPDAILGAVWSIWEGAKSVNVQAYTARHAVSVGGLQMAVILQEMVTPVYSGVALSRNPVTGADEVVVEAVEGLGEKLVQDGVTPDRWINKWGTTILRPVSESAAHSVAEKVVVETRRIAKLFKSPVDLEWVSDGVNLSWLQVRDITTLNRHNVFSNHISKEVIPGIIKPLIGSVNIPLVCSMWIRLVNEMVGSTSVKPEDLARSFYYRVYFNMGALGKIFNELGMPADSVESLMGVIPADVEKPPMKPTFKTFLRFPNLIRFFLDKWFFAPRMRRAIHRSRRKFAGFDYRRADELAASELFTEIDRLYGIVQDAAYYNIVGPLLMMMYHRVLQNQLEKLGVDESQFDLMAEVPALADYDPNYHLYSLHEKFQDLSPALRESIRQSTYADFKKLPDIDEFQGGVASFLERFGQFSDSGNDFSKVPWRESPDMVLHLIANFTPAGTSTEGKIRFSDLGLTGSQRMKAGFFYRRAREFRLLREQVSAAYTYGYGLFRYYYLALGKHLVRRGHLDDPQDVFYLSDPQVRALLHEEAPGIDAREIVAGHQADIARFENITLPPVIYGDDAPPIEDNSKEKLVGVPTSIGHYTGEVAVVRGIKDFNKVQDGDVLVIPFSDVGWTPLFARAGAVVAESGGLLSHSSIVAREYNIPAIVSVSGAMRLKDRTVVTVNGHNGEVLIHEARDS